jgi:hypothetical protein
MVTFAVHLFIDAWPTGWMKAIMDCERNPKLAFFAYLEALRPLLVSLRMDRWAAFAGETLGAEIHLSNDTHETPTLRLCYQVEEAGKVICGGVCPVTPKPLANLHAGKLEWTAPEVATRTRYTIRASAAAPDGRVVSESTWDVSVFPRPTCPPPRVRGWRGAPPAWAEKIGVEESSDAGVVLVRGEALCPGQDADMQEIVRLAEGGASVVLSLLGEGVYRIGGDRIEILECANGPRYAACRNTGHPMVEGFAANDFRFWLDEDVGYPTPFLRTTFFAPSWNAVVKTATAAPRDALEDAGEDRFYLPSHAVAEKRFGAGRIIICQLNLAPYVALNPVAKIFALRLCGAA